MQALLKWLRNTYRKTITSIAFLPAVIALCFLLISYFMISFDFSTSGKSIKANLHWLSLKDASTARSICSAIAGGIISLAVFSFSMVMILLNQAASQMSNRILDRLIGNRFQQIVLGFYIGTIVYALFLLSTIRDINTGIYVPAISTYLLIALTVGDIFLFIYFLHYITHTVRYETIIYKIFENTKKALKESCLHPKHLEAVSIEKEGIVVLADKSGIFQGVEKKGFIQLCKKENVQVSLLFSVGNFVIENSEIARVYGRKELTVDFLKDFFVMINIEQGQEIDKNYYYGFRQLMEIAIKALSPGINDPGTAVISLQSLAVLFAYRLVNFPEPNYIDSTGVIRIVVRERTFEDLFEEFILPIWDYGGNDRTIQKEMLHVLTMLKGLGNSVSINKLLLLVLAKRKNSINN